MIRERRIRTLGKPISWRVWATVTTIALVYGFTGKWQVAAAVGGVEVIAKLLLYYVHERVWNIINSGKAESPPFVMWFTGLSGSGKSTLAQQLYQDLRNNGYAVELLDGDVVRSLFPSTGFSKQERDMHIRRVGYLASMLEKNGVIVLCSFISPYRETRDFVRTLCRRFVEVYVSTPLEVCEARDVKGLYKQCRRGEIRNFTGIDDPYEAPEAPEIRLDTSSQSLDDSFRVLRKEVLTLLA